MADHRARRNARLRRLKRARAYKVGNGVSRIDWLDALEREGKACCVSRNWCATRFFTCQPKRVFLTCDRGIRHCTTVPASLARTVSHPEVGTADDES